MAGHITITPDEMREKGYLLAREAARKIDVNPTTIYRWLSANKIEGFRDGFRSYVLWTSVLAWIGEAACEVRGLSSDDVWVTTELGE